jgi:hypothetical protein
VLAAAGAVALSPATPLGVARRAELDAGVAVDLPVLAVGTVAVTVGVLTCAAVAGWRAARAPAGQLGVTETARAERPSRVGTMLAAAGLPPTAVTGTRLALEPGQGRTAVPVRSAVALAAAGVCALTVAVTFSAGLRQLLGDQRAYGVTWDMQVGNFADLEGSQQAARTLAANPTVAAYAGGVTGSPDPVIDGRPVAVLSFAPGKGSLAPTVVEGRANPTRRARARRCHHARAWQADRRHGRGKHSHRLAAAAGRGPGDRQQHGLRDHRGRARQRRDRPRRLVAAPRTCGCR